MRTTAVQKRKRVSDLIKEARSNVRSGAHSLPLIDELLTEAFGLMLDLRTKDDEK